MQKSCCRPGPWTETETNFLQFRSSSFFLVENFKAKTILKGICVSVKTNFSDSPKGNVLLRRIYGNGEKDETRVDEAAFKDPRT